MFSLVAQCHLVLSVLGTLVTIMASVLHCFLSFVTTLSSASFIPVTSCISSIHLLLGRPLLLLLPSSHSFIHYGDLYSAPSRLLRSAPDPCTAKEKSFEARVVCVRKNPGEQSLRQRKPILHRGVAFSCSFRLLQQ